VRAKSQLRIRKNPYPSTAKREKGNTPTQLRRWPPHQRLGQQQLLQRPQRRRTTRCHRPARYPWTSSSGSATMSWRRPSARATLPWSSWLPTLWPRQRWVSMQIPQLINWLILATDIGLKIGYVRFNRYVLIQIAGV